MAKQSIRALVALLVVAFAGGCASVKESIHSATAPSPMQATVAPATPKPALQVSAPVAQPLPAPTTRKELGRFPSSSVTPIGKPWTVMHKDGFTGSVDDACKALGLTTAQCTAFKNKRGNGECTPMTIPNGVVLDALTFTRGGTHQVQKSVKVDLKNPLSREAVVCDIGNGVTVHHYLGCGNYGVVRNWTEPLERVVRVATPTPNQSCTKPLYVQINIWTNEALNIPGVLGTIEQARDGRGYYVPDRVSRKYGATLRTTASRSAGTHHAMARVVKPDGSFMTIFSGAIAGGTVQLPLENFGKGDIFLVSFGDLSKLASPISDLRAKYEEFNQRGCGPRTHLHAIER